MGSYNVLVKQQSVDLEHDWRRQLSLEHPIPEPTRDPESVLVVCKVVLQMILLELAPVRRQTANVSSACGLLKKQPRKGQTYVL